MSDTFVSVIIPAYNAASTVAETVESALAQDHVAKEVIVVNDGSKDDTLAVLQRFGSRIRVVDQPNAGPPAARNNGMAAAQGDYIAFLDADDVWIQGKLAAQARHLDAHPDVGTVFTNWWVWNAEPDGSFRRQPALEARHVTDEVDEPNSGWLYHRLLLESEMLTTTVMIRRSIVQRIGGFDLNLWNGDDYDYWLRLSREGRITRLKSIGALYRILPNSVSRSPKARNFEHEVVSMALQRWGRTGPDGTTCPEDAVRRRLERMELDHAYAHLLRGDAAIAWQGYRNALARHPLQPKLWLNAARAVLRGGLNATAAKPA
jgi:glycosyltransferase involved in cell wall biosynthesis